MSERLVPGRECGECHVCCDLLRPDRIGRKQASDRPCPNYSAGDGCALGEHRPPACATWHCAWREFDWLPEESRPDRLGLLLTVEREVKPGMVPEPYVLGRAVGGETAYKSLLAQDVLWAFMRELPVRVEVGQREVDYGGPDRFIDPRFL